jgi:hypothetical protein
MVQKKYVGLILLVVSYSHMVLAMEEPGFMPNLSTSDMKSSFLSLSSSQDSDEIEKEIVSEDAWCSEYFDAYIKEQFHIVEKENYNMKGKVINKPLSSVEIIENYENEASVKPELPGMQKNNQETITSLLSMWVNDKISDVNGLVKDLKGMVVTLHGTQQQQ